MISIADNLINVIIFVIQNTLLKILPVEISGFSISTFSSTFANATADLITAWKFINHFFPMDFLLSLLGIIITAEIILHFGFKGIKYIINVFRGSGG